MINQGNIIAYPQKNMLNFKKNSSHSLESFQTVDIMITFFHFYSEMYKYKNRYDILKIEKKSSE